jgi:hypothetical protein
MYMSNCWHRCEEYQPSNVHPNQNNIDFSKLDNLLDLRDCTLSTTRYLNPTQFGEINLERLKLKYLPTQSLIIQRTTKHIGLPCPPTWRTASFTALRIHAVKVTCVYHIYCSSVPRSCRMKYYPLRQCIHYFPLHSTENNMTSNVIKKQLYQVHIETNVFISHPTVPLTIVINRTVSIEGTTTPSQVKVCSRLIRASRGPTLDDRGKEGALLHERETTPRGTALRFFSSYAYGLAWYGMYV